MRCTLLSLQLSSDILADLMNGLEENSLDTFSYLLTGYVGSVSFLEQVFETIKNLKQKNPNILYGMDKGCLI